MNINKNYHFIQPLVVNQSYQGNSKQLFEGKNYNNKDQLRINASTNNFSQKQDENYNKNVNKILNEMNYLKNANSNLNLQNKNLNKNINNNNNNNPNHNQINNHIAIGNINPNFNLTKNKFSMNFNLPNQINPQDRVINFGQDKSENTFKKTLRNGANNLIQNNSYNIINHNPIHNGFNNIIKVGGFNYTNNFPESNINLNLNQNQNQQNSYSHSAGKNNILGFKNYGTNLNNPSPNSNSNSNSNINKNVFEKNASCVKEFSYKEDPNIRYREYMEDIGKTIDKFNGNPNMGLFMIFDGHGGGEIAKYLNKRLPDIISKNLIPSNNSDEYNYDIENALINSFNKIDEEIKMMSDSEYMGSTAVIVLISKEKNQISPLNTKRVIYCANIGDSRSVLVTNYGVKRISYDHKASDPSEVDRINKSGGIIFNGRVFGQLIITRAFGDNSLKRHGVIVTPYISKNFVTEKDKYIVLASDGVWDVIDDDELINFSQNISNSDDFAKLIIKTSLLRGSQDNLSCIVLKL
jgi:protein phosphatase PTC1